MMLILMLHVYCCEVNYGVDYVAKMFYEVEFQDAKWSLLWHVWLCFWLLNIIVELNLLYIEAINDE